MTDINCPYCDAELDICHDDGFGYDESKSHEMQCSECDKYFLFDTSISFSYEAKQADCLNGSEHEYKLSRTYPKEYSKLRCVHCDHIKEGYDHRVTMAAEEAINQQPKG